MSIQQATSRRGITHLVDPSRQTIGPFAERTFKALCGAEVGRARVQPANWPPAGRSCLGCAREIARENAWNGEVAAAFARGLGVAA